MGEVYDEFLRELAEWREKYRNNPRAEMIRLLMMALEREALVSSAYRDDMLSRRISAMPVPTDIQELIRHALIWAWKDEEMHAIFIRGVIFRMGSPSLRIQAFVRQMFGLTGGWAGSVRQHVHWASAPLSHTVATLITWAGIVTGQVPPDVRKYLSYGSFRDFCSFQVDAEKTARLAYERLLELLPGLPDAPPSLIDDFTRIRDDEERHTRIFEIMLATIDDKDGLLPGENTERLKPRIGEIGEIFLPRVHRTSSNAGQPVGSGGAVWVMQGRTAEEKAALFERLLDESGLSIKVLARAEALGKPLQDLQIAIKPSFMLGYSHADLSPITDPALVEALARYLHEHGCANIAVVEAQNIYDRFYAHRSVQEVAQYFNMDSPNYRIVDLTKELVSYTYYRGLAQYAVGQTWQQADFRISFGKLRTHPIDLVYLAVGNLEGMGNRSDEFVFSERKSHRDTAVMMLMNDFPPHFAILDGYDSAPDGLLGMMGSPNPRIPRRFYAGADALAVDIVAARHLGVSQPTTAPMLRTACYWFGDPSARLQVIGPDEPVSGWRSPYHNEWSTLLSLFAYPVYQYGSGRGALFVAEMDEGAFPSLVAETPWLRFRRKFIQTLLGLRLPKKLPRKTQER